MIYTCPFCHIVCSDDGDITSSYFVSHDCGDIDVINNIDDDNFPDVAVISMSKCPVCKKTSIRIEPHCKSKGFSFSFSYPPMDTKPIPNYVPNVIRNDYQEAVSIVDLSPRSSATLSRRCLQGMIRDFWNIKAPTLYEEIAALKDKIPASQWSAIDALRKIGNIGAHMEKDINLIIDVEPDEAKSLIKLIELLIDKWYVARHDEEALLADITNLGHEKQKLRKSPLSGCK